MTGANCSYANGSGIYIEVTCTTAQPYCCSGTGNQYCSDSKCASDTTTSSSKEFSAILFWGVLGGLIFLSVIVIMLTYVICYVRKPNGCMTNPVEELFQETVEEEIHTTTTSNSHTAKLDKEASPALVLRTEKFRKVTTRQRSRNNIFQPGGSVAISVSSANPSDENSNNRTKSDVKRLVTSHQYCAGKGRTENVSISPRNVVIAALPTIE